MKTTISIIFLFIFSSTYAQVSINLGIQENFDYNYVFGNKYLHTNFKAGAVFKQNQELGFMFGYGGVLQRGLHFYGYSYLDLNVYYEQLFLKTQRKVRPSISFQMGSQLYSKDKLATPISNSLQSGGTIGYDAIGYYYSTVYTSKMHLNVNYFLKKFKFEFGLGYYINVFQYRRDYIYYQDNLLLHGLSFKLGIDYSIPLSRGK